MLSASLNKTFLSLSLQKLVTLGHETINTPLYMQLDADHCHLVTDQLQRYALIGESVAGGRAVKILRLAAFAPAITPSLDYSIRVYVVEDTADALEVTQRLTRHSGCSIQSVRSWCGRSSDRSFMVEMLLSIYNVYVVSIFTDRSFIEWTH